MAFAMSGLKGDGYLPGGNMKYGYSTADTQATVAGANYFNSAVKIFRVGDQIMVNAGVGGTMVSKWYVVSAVTATVVTIATHSYA